MRFVPNALPPTPRPTLADAEVLGDVEIEARISIVVGKGVSFAFWRTESGDWTGGSPCTAARHVPIDEAWLVAARGVAVEALKREIMERGLGSEEPTDVVRCGECSRLLCAAELVDAGRQREIACGAEHAITFEDGRTLLFAVDGVRWLLGQAATDGIPSTERSPAVGGVP